MIVSNIITEKGTKAKSALPADFASKGKLPLNIFLHGISERGTNVEAVAKYGPIRQALDGLENNIIHIAPLLWSGLAWEADYVDDVIENAKKIYNIDEDRIYIGGCSWGGAGTLRYMAKYGKKIAAYYPICAADVSDTYAKAIAESGAIGWAAHGLGDPTTDFKNTRIIVKLINEIAGKTVCNFDILEANYHTIWGKWLGPKYYKKDTPEQEIIYPVYEWLLMQKRTPTPSVTNIEITGTYRVLS